MNRKARLLPSPCSFRKSSSCFSINEVTTVPATPPSPVIVFGEGVGAVSQTEGSPLSSPSSVLRLAFASTSVDAGASVVSPLYLPLGILKIKYQVDKRNSIKGWKKFQNKNLVESVDWRCTAFAENQERRVSSSSVESDNPLEITAGNSVFISSNSLKPSTLAEDCCEDLFRVKFSLN